MGKNGKENGNYYNGAQGLGIIGVVGIYGE